MTSHRVPVAAIRENAIVMVDDANDQDDRALYGALVVVRAYNGMPAGADLMLADRLAENTNAQLVAQHIADAAIGDPDALREEDGVTLLVVDEDDRAHVVYFPSLQTEIDLLDDLDDEDDFDQAEAA